MYECAFACFVYTPPMATHFGGYLSAAITTINHKKKNRGKKCLFHKFVNYFSFEKYD